MDWWKYDADENFLFYGISLWKVNNKASVIPCDIAYKGRKYSVGTARQYLELKLIVLDIWIKALFFYGLICSP